MKNELECTSCGSKNLILGDIYPAHSLNIYFSPKENSCKSLKKNSKISVYACGNCGKIEIYVEKT